MKGRANCPMPYTDDGEITGQQFAIKTINRNRSRFFGLSKSLLSYLDGGYLIRATLNSVLQEFYRYYKLQQVEA